MKKLIYLMGIVGALNADLLSVSAGAGFFNQKIDGYVKIGNTINYFNNASAQTDGNYQTGDFGLKNKSNPYFWAKLISPIPLIPNVKFQYTKYDTTGHSNYIAGGVKVFGDVEIPTALTDADTELNINSYDFTFFYEFKPMVADIEAGMGVDYWQGNLTISGVGGGVRKTWVNNDWQIILPYLYAHAESMQIHNVSLLANVKWAKFEDNHHYDYSAAVKYTFDIVGPINPFVKAGYRYKDVYGVDGDDKTSLKYKGLFLEIGAKF